MATTIPAGTLRLLLTSISYRAKARKEMRRKPPMVPRRAPAAGLPRRVEGVSRCALTAVRCQIASRRAWKALRRRRAGMVCDMLHCLAWIHNRDAPRPYIHYYNRAAALTCTASRRGAGIWYMLEVLRRCDTLRRGARGIIAACVGLVFVAVK